VTRYRAAVRVRAGRIVIPGKLETDRSKGENPGRLDEQNELATDREHRNKYTGDNGEDGRHLEGGGDEHKDR
jgi:hypothetical protein